jgi:hypothetical protein
VGYDLRPSDPGAIIRFMIALDRGGFLSLMCLATCSNGCQARLSDAPTPAAPALRPPPPPVLLPPMASSVPSNSAPIAGPAADPAAGPSPFVLMAETNVDAKLERAGEAFFITDQETLLARVEGGFVDTSEAIRVGLPSCATLQRWRTTPTKHGDDFSIVGVTGTGQQAWLSAQVPRNDGLHGVLYRWVATAKGSSWRRVRELAVPYWSYSDVDRWTGGRWLALVSRSHICLYDPRPDPDDDDGHSRHAKRVNPCEGMPSKFDHHFELVDGPPKPVPIPTSIPNGKGCWKAVEATRLASFETGEVFTFGLDCPSATGLVTERWTGGGAVILDSIVPEPGTGSAIIDAKAPNDIVASDGVRIVRFDGKVWNEVPAPQSGARIESVVRAPDGSLWVAMPTGVYQNTGGNWQTIALPRAVSVDVTDAPYLPESLHVSADGELWMLARHPDCALLASGNCRRGFFRFQKIPEHDPGPHGPGPAPRRISSVCPREPEPDVAPPPVTAACTTVFVRLSGPRLSPPADRYWAIRRVLQGHTEFGTATFGTFHPSGGAWFGAYGLTVPLAERLVNLVSARLPQLHPLASCEKPTLGERMDIDLDHGTEAVGNSRSHGR